MSKATINIPRYYSGFVISSERSESRNLVFADEGDSSTPLRSARNDGGVLRCATEKLYSFLLPEQRSRRCGVTRNDVSRGP
jgi:hypothetical protein